MVASGPESAEMENPQVTTDGSYTDESKEERAGATDPSDDLVATQLNNFFADREGNESSSESEASKDALNASVESGGTKQGHEGRSPPEPQAKLDIPRQDIGALRQ